MKSSGHEGRPNSSSRSHSRNHCLLTEKAESSSNGKFKHKNLSRIPSCEEQPVLVDDRKQTIINNILEDLRGLEEAPVTNHNGNTQQQLHSSKSAEEIADAAQSLLMFQSSGSSGSVGEDTDQALVKALLNFSSQGADMAPPSLPCSPYPHTDHCLAGPTVLPAVTKIAPSLLEKPETLSVVSTATPLCSINHNTDSQTNGTPELLEDIQDHELAELLPGLSGAVFPLDDLHSVGSQSTSNGGHLATDDLESLTKAGSLLHSILSASPPKTTQAPSNQSASNAAFAEKLTFLDEEERIRASGGSDLRNRLSERKNLSSPVRLAGLPNSSIPKLEVTDQRKSEQMNFYLPDESEADRYVSLFDYRLPRVIPVHSTDSDPQLVCIFDVFQSFFSKHHWDAFKGILEKNQVPVRSVQSGTNAGSVDVVEVIEVPHLERLLLSNTARKDGFVKCLKMNKSDGCLASTLINTREPEPAELTSGIRTRHGDHSDISYVMWEGKKICSLLIGDGTEWVRLVDVQKNLISPHLNFVSVPQMNMVKEMCQELGIEVERCANSQKHRMVVYGASYRSNTLACINVNDLSRLMEAMKAMSSKKNLKRVRSAEEDESRSSRKRRRDISPDSSLFSDGMSSGWDGCSSDDSESETEVDDEDETDSSLQSTSRPESALSVESRSSGGGIVPQNADMQTVIGMTDKIFSSVSQRLEFLKEQFYQENGKLLLRPPSVPEQAAYRENLVRVPREIDLRTDEEIMKRLDPGLVRQCLPLRVVLERSAPLKMMVGNLVGGKGPIGDYYDHLFLSASTPCIFCFQCRRHFAVGKFVNHSHDFPLFSPKLFLYFAGASTRVDLWERFQKKLAKFKIFDLLYELPEGLGFYHDRRKRQFNWRFLSRTGKKPGVMGLPQVLADSPDDWLDRRLEEQAKNPMPPHFEKSVVHNPIEKKLQASQSHLRGNAFDAVLRKKWRISVGQLPSLDPLNFVIGSHSDAEKEQAIERWYSLDGD